MISIIIATKNGAKYISKALDSVLDQSVVKESPQEVEIIVVSDGSNDTTAHVVRTYIAGFPHVKIEIIELTQNIGPGLARNIGVSKASGSLIAFIDDDDIWLAPEKLKIQKEFLDSHTDVAVVGSSHVLFAREKNGVLIPEKNWMLTNETNSEKIHQNMLSSNPLITSSVLIRKSAFEQVGGFKAMRLAEDYDLWLRIGQIGKIANVDGADIQYTVRDGGASRTNKLNMSRTVLHLAKEYRYAYPRYIKARLKGYLRLILLALRLI